MPDQYEDICQTLAQTDAGQALNDYLEQRDLALSAADDAGLSGKRDADLRTALRSVGDRLSEEVPESRAMRLGVLKREVTTAGDQGKCQ